MAERDNLLAKRRELEQMIEDKRNNLGVPMSESSDDLSMYDQHPADAASDLFEREKDSGMLELLEIELEKVNTALSRYENGQYGSCEKCGKAIEAERLRTLPATKLCSNCAHTEKNEYKRPTEEKVISPAVMADLGETFQVAGFELYEEEN